MKVSTDIQIEDKNIPPLQVAETYGISLYELFDAVQKFTTKVPVDAESVIETLVYIGPRANRHGITVTQTLGWMLDGLDNGDTVIATIIEARNELIKYDFADRRTDLK